MLFTKRTHLVAVRSIPKDLSGPDEAANTMPAIWNIAGGAGIVIAAATRHILFRKRDIVFKMALRSKSDVLLTPQALASFNIQERVLLFCLASATDWERAGVTYATAQQVLVRGLINRASTRARFKLTPLGRDVTRRLAQVAVQRAGRIYEFIVAVMSSVSDPPISKLLMEAAYRATLLLTHFEGPRL